MTRPRTWSEILFVLMSAWAQWAYAPAWAQGPANVLVVANDSSPLSKNIAEYYVRKRGIPLKNLCRIQVSPAESIDRTDYARLVAKPIAECLRRENLTEQILYVVTTQGVPLQIQGNGGEMATEAASVDSELTLLYRDLLTGVAHGTRGPLSNPLFGHVFKHDEKFAHQAFPMYLVTRLAAYNFAGVRALIDRGMVAKNVGKFVIDLRADGSTEGNGWLREAAKKLPADRVILDDSATVLYNQSDVIAYASWGSNDRDRHERRVNFRWLPGALATEFVSTNARTFTQPPARWNIGPWTDPAKRFFGSPQTMTADYLADGASAATGHVDEPYLNFTPRPDFLLPAYYEGRNLAESFYLSIPAVSWQNVVIGDPLMSLGTPPLSTSAKGAAKK
jgi:uncharacterized protein (TIGR03790 family)